MKKLMTIAAMLLVAGMTQAASLSWGAAIAKADGQTAIGTGSTAYLIYSATDDIFSGALTTFNTATKLTNLGGSSLATHTITPYEAGTAFAFTDMFTRTDDNGGVNGYWQLVLIDNDDPTKFDAWSTSVTGASDSTGASEAQLNPSWSGAEFLGDSFQTTVVPEPTSMALLALGVAALGLRRKFRK